MNKSVLSEDEIIRAWKDDAFLLSLTEEQRQYVAGRFPAGVMELSDEELAHVAGGRDYVTNLSQSFRATWCKC